jgi:hypothetical protein
MAFLMRKANSKSGLLENMAGYNEVDSPGADFAGIATSMDSVEFRCLDVPTQFLEKLGFGLYSVVHKNDYNLETGAWNDPKKAISSGPYRIHSWTDEHLELKLRSDFPPDVFTNKKFETVRLVWGNNKDAHLYAGDSLTPPLREGLVFSGGAKNRIQYLRIVSWPNSQIITSDIEFRKDFRNAFYEELKALKFAPVLSFLPLAISGVKEFQLPTRKSTPYPKKIIRLADSRNRGGWRATALEAMAQAAIKLGMEVQYVPFELAMAATNHDPHAATYDYDISVNGTGILIEQPEDDMRFMIQSKQGIRLPDPTGRLHSLTSQKQFTAHEMNEILWDDALVWPIAHSASGIWMDETKVDYSLLNSIQPPTEIALIQPR